MKLCSQFPFRHFYSEHKTKSLKEIESEKSYTQKFKKGAEEDKSKKKNLFLEDNPYVAGLPIWINFRSKIDIFII